MKKKKQKKRLHNELGRERLPTLTVLKAARKLFADDDERESFLKSLLGETSTIPALLWLEDTKRTQSPWKLSEVHSPITLPSWVVLPENGARPGKHPLHEEGAYYCIDLSSAVCASVLSAVKGPIQRVVDLCAAPGGKSVFMSKAFAPEELVCHETIGKRLPPLISNIRRCIEGAVLVTQGDPSMVASRLRSWGQVVLVDAPCSGQSLEGKGDEIFGTFHETVINLNRNRQRRVLSEASKIVSPGGYLAYTTCTFALEENEQNVDWFIKQFPEFSPVEVPHLAPLRSVHSSLPCYRVFPQDRLGRGGFAVLLKKEGVPESVSVESAFSLLQPAWKQEGSPSIGTAEQHGE